MRKKIHLFYTLYHFCVYAVSKWQKNVILNLWHKTIHHSFVDVTTAEAWITMPKNASYHPSPKSATFVRALTTWLPAAQWNHSSHHQVLRENSFPWRGTKGSTITWQCLTIGLIKQEIRKHSCRESTKASQTALIARWGMWSTFVFCSYYLRLEKKGHKNDWLCFICFSNLVTLR